METQRTSEASWAPNEVTPGDVRRASWIAFFAWVFAVYDFILFGTLLPEIGKQFGWSAADQAALATWVAVGTAIVALAVGPVVDKFGRRAGMITTVVGAAICSFLTAFAGGLGKFVLIIIRSLSGMGYAEQTVNSTYLNEMYAAANDPNLTKHKGFIYSLVQGGWPIGALVAAALTALLLPIIGWQGCFIFAAVPAVVVAFFARTLKESPQFQGHQRILQLRQAGNEAQARSLAKDLNVDYEEHQAAGLGAVFRGDALRATLAVGGAFLLNWFAIQVFGVLGTTVITSVHKVTFENSLVILVLSNVVGYCGYLTHGYFGDKIGRRNVIAIGWILGGIAFSAMLFGPSNFSVVVALYSLGLFFLIGPYSALLFFIGESYTTAIRATGGTFVSATGPIGAIIAGLGATAILSHGGDWKTAAFYFGAIPCFVSGLLVLAAKHVDPEALRG